MNGAFRVGGSFSLPRGNEGECLDCRRQMSDQRAGDERPSGSLDAVSFSQWNAEDPKMTAMMKELRESIHGRS